MTDHPPQPTVALYLRSLVPNGEPTTQITTIRHLESIAEAGDVEDCSIHVTGRGFVHEDCCLSTPTGRTLVDRVTAIENWADANDAHLPGISTTTIEASPMREQQFTVTSIPHRLLLEYERGSLRFVSPVTIDDTHITVSDHLDALDRSTGAELPARTHATVVGTAAEKTDEQPELLPIESR